jgi:acyl carrier protein
MTDATRRLTDKIAEITRRPREDVRTERLLRELVQDSFSLVEMVIELQEEFAVQVSQSDFAGVVTVGDLMALFESRLPAQT